jgi:D-alanyl-D-alanine carboxypeptidase
VEGPFLFNWKPDPRGRRFKQTLSGHTGMAAWRAVEAHGGTTKKVELEDVALQFTAGEGGDDRDRETLLLHESAPLVRLLKEFNGYSNNIFHIFTQRIGGTDVVEKIARGAVPERSRSRVRIDNGAGGGRTNRVSPRATVAILRALEQELNSHGLALRAVLPVAGVDAGTLESRLETANRRGAVVGKTGTLPSIGVSALAGVAHTRRYGRVYFAILNQGVPIWKARKQQDAFISALLERAGPAPPVYRPPEAPAFTEARIR